MASSLTLYPRLNFTIIIKYYCIRFIIVERLLMDFTQMYSFSCFFLNCSFYVFCGQTEWDYPGLS